MASQANDLDFDLKYENVLKTSTFYLHIVPKVFQFCLNNCCKKTLKDNWRQYIVRTLKPSNTQMKKWFDKSQTPKLENTNCESFDVTLLYILIELANDSVCYVDHPLNPLEFCLKRLKTGRNSLSHNVLEKQLHLFGDLKEFNESIDQCLTIIQESSRRFGVDPTLKTDFIAYFTKELENLKTFKILKNLKFVIEHCVEEIKAQYKKNQTRINPFFFNLNESRVLPVKQVFSELKVVKSLSKLNGETINFSEFFDLIQQTDNTTFILLKGSAGSGKTTVVQKIIEEWLHEEDYFTGISDYDILFHVECRNRKINSVDEYFNRIFPNVCNESMFSSKQFCYEVNDTKKCLWLVDGFDEANADCEKFLQEIISTFNTSNFLITLRPEALEDLSPILPRNQNKALLELMGINNYEEFVINYLSELSQNDLDKKDELLKNIMSAVSALSTSAKHFLNLPLNLVLYINLCINYDNITFELPADLMKKLEVTRIQKMTTQLQENLKIKPRILNKKLITIAKKIEEVAWKLLRLGKLTIDDNTFDKLSELCDDLELPAEQVIASFLTYKPPDLTQLRPVLTFPHKSYQEFYAANYTVKQLKHSSESDDVKIHKEFEDVLCPKLFYDDYSQFIESFHLLLSIITNDDDIDSSFLSAYSKEMFRRAHEKFDLSLARLVIYYTRKKTCFVEAVAAKMEIEVWSVYQSNIETILFLLDFISPKNIKFRITPNLDEDIFKIMEKLSSPCRVHSNFEDDADVSTIEICLEVLSKRECAIVTVIGILSAKALLSIESKFLENLTIGVGSDDQANALSVLIQKNNFTGDMYLRINERVSSASLESILSGSKCFSSFIFVLHYETDNSDEIKKYAVSQLSALSKEVNHDVELGHTMYVHDETIHCISEELKSLYGINVTFN